MVMDAAAGKSIRPNQPVENRLMKMPNLLNQFLEDTLACPVCRGPLHAGPTPAKTLWLTCSRCRLRYPVEDGIPVLIRERAVPDGNERSMTKVH